MPSQQCNAVNYRDFLRFINWRDCPVAPITAGPPQPDTWQGNQHQDQIQKVNVQCLKKDL